MTDDADLTDAELSIFDDLCAGDASSLAAYLRAGNVPSRALGIELADMIEHGELVAVMRQPSQAQLSRQVRDDRDLAIGAWVWIRKLHVRGATLEAIETEAVSPGGLNYSRAAVHRAYLKFKKLMETGDEFDLVQAKWALYGALKQLCEDAGFDFYEQIQRLYSVQNLDLEIAPRK